MHVTHDAAIAQLEGSLPVRRREGVVGDHDDGQPSLRVQLEEDVEDRPAGLRIEVAGGFVREDETRLRDQRAGDRHALLLAAGKLGRQARARRRVDAHLLECLGCPHLGGAPPKPDEAENESQPEVFSSIPEAFWWASMTMSNVNYVDMHPITPFGRFIGVALTLLDVALLAVPTAILGSGFVEEFHKSKESPLCPHCGQSIEGGRRTEPAVAPPLRVRS